MLVFADGMRQADYNLHACVGGAQLVVSVLGVHLELASPAPRTWIRPQVRVPVMLMSTQPAIAGQIKSQASALTD